MLFNRFFKQPKPNKFGYTPVFYDERKIERERLIKEAKENGSADMNRASMDFSGTFGKERELKASSNLNSFKAQGNAKSNRTLLIVLILIFGLVYIQLAM